MKKTDNDKSVFVLLNPPWITDDGRRGVRAGSRWPHLKTRAEARYLPFPFFLAYATSLLKKNGFTAILIDAIAEGLDETAACEAVMAHAPTHVIVETSTVTGARDRSFLSRLPSTVTVIMTGPDASFAERDYFSHNPRVQYVIRGEYEWALLELARAMRDGSAVDRIAGLRSRDSDGAGVQPALCTIDRLPWPERDQVPLSKYHDVPGGIPEPSVQMLASRGCPFGCAFCLWPHVMYGGTSYRMRDPHDVVDEMEHLVHDRGFKSIYFDDDSFGLDRQWVMRFADELIRRRRRGRITVPWAMMTRADRMDDELLALLRTAGLAAVKYGIECDEPGPLAAVGKSFDHVRAYRMVGATKKCGIGVHLTFMMGLPGETVVSLLKTVVRALVLNPASVQFSIATPLPGTPLYDRLKSAHVLVAAAGDAFDGNARSVIKTATLRPGQVVFFRALAQRVWGLFVRVRRVPALVRSWVRRVGVFAGRRLRYLGIMHGCRAFIGPHVIQLDLTNDCNNDCIGCWSNSPLLGDARLSADEKKLSLPFEKVAELIEDAATMHVQQFYLAGGGEPFMYPRIMDVIRSIKARGMRVCINTNFTLVTEAMIDEMVVLGVDELTVSVWAGTPAVYGATHPNKDAQAFRQLQERLQYLSLRKNNKPWVKIYHVVSSVNSHEMQEMYAFARDVRADAVEFTVVDIVPGKTDRLLLAPEQITAVQACAGRLREQAKNGPALFHFDQFLRRLDGGAAVSGNYDANIIDSIPCTVGWTFSRVLPGGNVNGCLKAHRIPVGNIIRQRFKTIWNDGPQQQFRRETRVREKRSPFFAQIGNDHSAAVGCHRGCDDWARNEDVYGAMQRLSSLERRLLRACARALPGFQAEKAGES